MKWLVVLLLLPPALLTGALLLNRPPLFAPPGLLERLRTYLQTNIAETRPEHPFPELRTPLVPVDEAAAQAAVVAAMQRLGWSDVQGMRGEVRAVVVTPLFRFRDDVTVRLEEAGGGTLLHARSASRVGKGDLAANARHLRDLFGAVEHLAVGP